MRAINGGKGKGDVNGVASDVQDLRDQYAKIADTQRRLAMLAAEFNLALTRAAVKRNVTEGWGLDLNDGKLKPNNEIQPYKG